MSIIQDLDEHTINLSCNFDNVKDNYDENKWYSREKTCLINLIFYWLREEDE